MLPESLYEEWTQARRAHLRSLQAKLLRLSGQWDRLVALEPSDEAAYQELMRAELAAGRWPIARKQPGRRWHTGSPPCTEPAGPRGSIWARWIMLASSCS